MNVTGTALVLQGGGARGIFTAGVLDVLLENKIYFPYCLGVSAGAFNAINYASRQKGRSHKLIKDLLGDKRFAGYGNLFRRGNYFNFPFLLEEVPRKILPFDERAFKKSYTRCVCSAFDCDTGESAFFYQDGPVRLEAAIAASASLPLLSRIVTIDGHRYLDGGLADPFPYRQAFKDGYDKVVLVLTRERGYRKGGKEDRHPFLSPLRYPFRRNRIIRRKIKTWAARDNLYYEDVEHVDPKKVFVIRPESPLGIKRTGKDPDRLEEGYLSGRRKATELLRDLLAFINE